MEAIHGEHRHFERDERRGISFVLALAMHGLLALFLVMSVQWRTQHVEAVSVELWGSPPPEPVVVPPQPQVIEPAKVEPKPEPVPEKKPEIVEEKVKPKPVEKPKPKPASPPKVEKKPVEPKPEVKKEPEKKLETKAKPAEPSLAELINKGMEQRNKSGDVPTLPGGKPGGTGTNPKALTNAGPGTGAGGGGKLGNDYLGLVRRLILSNIGYPATTPDNPKAKIKVFLLPDGTIRDAQLVKAVGDPAYAEAARRAVMTTQKFPPQPDGKLFSGDTREWTLSFCAKENVECKVD